MSASDAGTPDARERVPTSQFLHPHDLISAIDVYDLAGNRGCTVACQKHPCVPKLGRVATSFKRRMFLVVFEHGSETGYSTGGKSLHRACTDAVHSNLSWTQIVRQIARRGLEAGFRNSHDVVVWNNLFGAIVGHRNYTPSVRHQ